MKDTFNCNLELSKKELIQLLVLLNEAANRDEKITPLFIKLEKKAFELLTIDDIENIYKK
jgi:hypothetical protein